jgi:glycosyltransferase involved in cell wall biosynthesis
MKVLHVVNIYSDNGNPSAQPFVKAQIDSLKNAGVEVDVLNVKGNESKFNYFKAIGKFRKWVKGSRYNIVHGHYVYSGLIAALQHRIPTVVSFMGSDLLGSPKSNGKLQFRGYIDVMLSKILQYFVDGIIVKSSKMQDVLVNKSKSIVLPNGVDFDLFREISRDEARKKLGLDKKKKYILFVGNYKIPRKSFYIIKDAINILKSNGEDVDILLAYGLPHNHIPYYMNAANLIALSSIHEGSPNVIKEAMACNLPIVAADVGDIKEVIGKTEGCKIVQRNPEEFAEGIFETLNTIDRTKGRQAIEHLRVEKIAQRLVDFYAQVIDRKKARFAR